MGCLDDNFVAQKGNRFDVTVCALEQNLRTADRFYRNVTVSRIQENEAADVIQLDITMCCFDLCVELFRNRDQNVYREFPLPIPAPVIFG